MKFFSRLANWIKRELNLQRNHRLLTKLWKSIDNRDVEAQNQAVIFFNASTRLSGLSQNAGFSLVTSLALQADKTRIVHLVCDRGMSHCVLGTDNLLPKKLPPCAECVRTSSMIFDPLTVRYLQFSRDLQIEGKTKNLNLDELLDFKVGDFPAGELILPSLRWILRRHHLFDDKDTRFLAREYVLSAWNLKLQFESVISEINPLAVVVFNGMFYPEAALRWTAQARGIPVYSHEVGMLPLSAFFTDQEATAYPVKVDANFQLTESQDRILDDYLANRMQGDFVTAGIKFWPEMKKLDDDFWRKAGQFQSIVPVFTNVVFDTSQSHANVFYEHMFQWLDDVLEAIKDHPDVFFVIRAHPDELRPGKTSRETVADWISKNQVDLLSNVIFVPSDMFVSSYELIQSAKFVMVYNSTVGLEASILGKPVLCAGKARYTQIPTVFFPKSRKDYQKQLQSFLIQRSIENPEQFRLNARRVLYSQLFRASLPFNDFLEEDGVWKGYVRLKDFSIDDLFSDKTPSIQVVLNGILHRKPLIREI